MSKSEHDMLPFMRLCSYFLLALCCSLSRMPALPTAVPIRVGTALAVEG